MTDEEKAAEELANSNDPTPINDDDLLAAVSAAVDEQTITPEGENENDDATDGTGDDDTTVSASDESGAGDGTEGDSEESEVGEPADKEVDGESEEAGP